MPATLNYCLGRYFGHFEPEPENMEYVGPEMEALQKDSWLNLSQQHDLDIV